MRHWDVIEHSLISKPGQLCKMPAKKGQASGWQKSYSARCCDGAAGWLPLHSEFIFAFVQAASHTSQEQFRHETQPKA